MMVATMIVGARAQESAEYVDSVESPKVSVNVGLAAGVNLLNNGNDDSPYYSQYGTTVQVPITVDYKINNHWHASAGLRYDFNWSPMAHNVAINYNADMTTNGIDFDTTPRVGKSSAYAFHQYLGIPIRITWYPWVRERTILGIGLDFYAGYALTRSITIKHNGAEKEKLKGDDSSLVPWKMEIGLTITTDVIGLLHGIRFSANLLPTYIDPKTGEKIYTLGMTFFL